MFDRFLLVKLRMAEKISQRELANRIFVDNHVIRTLESNQVKNPSFETVAKVAHYYKRPMEDFINKDYKW